VPHATVGGGLVIWLATPAGSKRIDARGSPPEHAPKLANVSRAAPRTIVSSIRDSIQPRRLAALEAP